MLHPDQYSLVADRRIAYDNLLWQTPVLSLTAQAFLFAIAFGEGQPHARFPAGILVILVAGASLQLMAKHRAHEVWMSRLLEEYERGTPGFAVVHSKPVQAQSSGWVKASSYVVWVALMWCFLFAGGWAVWRSASKFSATPAAAAQPQTGAVVPTGP